MDYTTLKDKVKKMGLRVTKNVKGKRVKLTHKELERKVSGLTLQNQARNATKFIRVCKMVLREAGPNAPRVVQRVAQPVRTSPRRAPPPPPPMGLNPRAALLANLKANLKKRGLAKN